MYDVSTVFRGGTEMTVFGSNLNSVAQPRITLTVVVTRYNDTQSVKQNAAEAQSSSYRETDSGVI